MLRQTALNILICLAFFPMSGCDETASPVVIDNGISGGDSSSSPTEINIGLPDRSQWKQAVQAFGNIETLMNGYQLIIQPTDPNCANATKVNQVSEYGTTSRIQNSLQQGCDYQITLALGSRDTTTNLLKAAYYKNNVAQAVAKTEIAGQSSFRVRINLQRQPDGAAIGLPEDGVGSGVPPVTPPVVIPPTTTGPQLRAGQDFDLTGGASKLSQIFKSDYMVIDVSAASCGPCVTMATNEDSNSSFQAMFGPGKKCDYAVFVMNGELADWTANFSGNGFIATHSYGVQRTPGVGEAFGISTSRTPTVFIIDKQGTIKGSAVGSTPSQVEQLCR